MLVVVYVCVVFFQQPRTCSLFNVLNLFEVQQVNNDHRHTHKHLLFPNSSSNKKEMKWSADWKKKNTERIEQFTIKIHYHIELYRVIIIIRFITYNMWFYLITHIKAKNTISLQCNKYNFPNKQTTQKNTNCFHFPYKWFNIWSKCIW